ILTRAWPCFTGLFGDFFLMRPLSDAMTALAIKLGHREPEGLPEQHRLPIMRALAHQPARGSPAAAPRVLRPSTVRAPSLGPTGAQPTPTCDFFQNRIGNRPARFKQNEKSGPREFYYGGSQKSPRIIRARTMPGLRGRTPTRRAMRPALPMGFS